MKRVLNYEVCREVALKYNRRYDLEKGDRGIYNKIHVNKWFELFSHMESKYLTYEKCKKISLNFKTRGELSKKEGATHRTILSNGWLELLVHMIPVGNIKKRMIYVYEFTDGYFYVGLTYNIYNRDKSHFKENSKSSVFKHMNKTLLIPILIHISGYIDVYDAMKLEESTLNTYLSNGWKPLNIVKTGGLGSNNVIWTYEKCKEEALKYNKRTDFKKYSPVAYKTTHFNKWKELLKHMKLLHRNWTYDEIILLSKKYNKISHFKSDFPGAYVIAKRENWLMEIKKNMHIPVEKWTYERCKEEALKYKYKSDFMSHSSGAFQASKREKWYNEICNHMNRKKKI